MLIIRCKEEKQNGKEAFEILNIDINGIITILMKMNYTKENRNICKIDSQIHK
ncbi:hypothetical protein [uncultured Clostridium sp.]|uniref:hypothetical protein n=1 Tax=uncultured Clostridium sp. TaxID=59620 RepID=UPI002617EEF9|nr:hypothetical protein [uncultured Clostridium sp.]